MIEDKRYVPKEVVYKNMSEDEIERLKKYVSSHPKMSGVRYHKDGRQEDFVMESEVTADGEHYYHFAFVNAFKAAENA